MLNSVRCGIVLATVLVLGFTMDAAAAGPVIEVREPVSPPAWALLEREVLRAGSSAVELFYDKYFDERGYLLHVARWGILDGTDDAIETFRKLEKVNRVHRSHEPDRFRAFQHLIFAFHDSASNPLQQIVFRNTVHLHVITLFDVAGGIGNSRCPL